MFDRVVNQLSAAAATTSAGGVSTTSAQAATALLRFGGIERNQEKTEEVIREEDGLLNVGVAERMLKWHAEAIGRCVELTPSSDVCVFMFSTLVTSFLIYFFSAKHTFSLFRVLTEAITSAYVEAAIET